MARYHIAATGKSSGLMIRCPARIKCTLKTADGMPAHHGNFVYDADARNWNKIQKEVVTSGVGELECSSLAQDALEHETSLPDSTVQKVIENQAAAACSDHLPHDEAELRNEIISLVPQPKSFDFTNSAERFRMQAFAENQSTSSADLAAIASSVVSNDDDKSYMVEARRHIGMSVASNGNAPQSALQTLSSCDVPEVRAAAARSLNVNQMTLDVMSQDSDSSVRAAVAGNAKISGETALRLANDGDESVRLALAKNDHCPARVLARLSRNGSDAIRLAVAENKNVAMSTIMRLADDSSSDVREMVQRNPKYEGSASGAAASAGVAQSSGSVDGGLGSVSAAPVTSDSSVPSVGDASPVDGGADSVVSSDGAGEPVGAGSASPVDDSSDSSSSVSASDAGVVSDRSDSSEHSDSSERSDSSEDSEDDRGFLARAASGVRSFFGFGR